MCLKMCVLGDQSQKFWDQGVLMSAQRKIPVVLYPVHQNPRFHGQKLILILSVHKNRSFHGQERHKAGIANDWQMVLWTFAVGGALWRSSRSLLCASYAELVPFFNDFSTSCLQNLQFDAKNNIAGASLSRKSDKL